MDDALTNQNFNYYLEPGYIYFSRTPVTIRTVVGSCVSVCLWDRDLRYGGMNHFVYPAIRNPEKATPQYGNVATAALLGMMQEAGCARNNIVAQVAGGASPAGGKEGDIGERNVEVARTVLKSKGIDVSSEDTGGSMGQKIVFDMRTGQMVTLKVHHLRDEDWVGGLGLREYSGGGATEFLDSDSNRRPEGGTRSEDDNI